MANGRLTKILKPVQKLFPLQANAKLVNIGFAYDTDIEKTVVAGKL